MDRRKLYAGDLQIDYFSESYSHFEEAPNFPKARECDVFLRGSGKDSTEKTFEINGLRMYPQFYWIKGSYLVKMLNQTDFLGK